MPGWVRDSGSGTWKELGHGDTGPKVYDVSVGWRAAVAFWVMQVSGDGTIESPYVYLWKLIDGSFLAPTETPDTIAAFDGAPNWTVNLTFASSSYWRRVVMEEHPSGGGVTFGPTWKAPGTTTQQYVGDSSYEGKVMYATSQFAYASGGITGPVSAHSNTVTLSELA